MHALLLAGEVAGEVAGAGAAAASLAALARALSDHAESPGNRSQGKGGKGVTLLCVRYSSMPTAQRTIEYMSPAME